MHVYFKCLVVRLVQSLNWTHSRLDVQRLHVLPMLLQQTHQEVHGQMNISHELVLCHGHVANSHGETEHLLHLELDGRFQVSYLHFKIVAVSHKSGELASLVQPWAQKPGNLLDQCVRGYESIVTLRQFLVLIELLQVVSRHKGNTLRLCVITMLLVTQEAHLELGAGDVLQLDGSGESLVLLGVIILEANLEVYCLSKLARLVLRMLQDSTYALVQGITRHLRHDFSCRSESSNNSLYECVGAVL